MTPDQLEQILTLHTAAADALRAALRADPAHRMAAYRAWGGAEGDFESYLDTLGLNGKE